MQNAITNAKAIDTTPTHFMPNLKETKAYQLGEAILNQVGVNDFNHFIASKLPQLIQIDVEKAKKAKMKKR